MGPLVSHGYKHHHGPTRIYVYNVAMGPHGMARLTGNIVNLGCPSNMDIIHWTMWLTIRGECFLRTSNTVPVHHILFEHLYLRRYNMQSHAILGSHTKCTVVDSLQDITTHPHSHPHHDLPHHPWIHWVPNHYNPLHHQVHRLQGVRPVACDARHLVFWLAEVTWRVRWIQPRPRPPRTPPI